MFGEERDYQIALAPAPPHPTTNGYLYSLLHSGGPGNIANHDDKVLDALIEVQAAELDPGPTAEVAAGPAAACNGAGLHVQPHHRLLPLGVRLGPGELLPEHGAVGVSLLGGGVVEAVRLDKNVGKKYGGGFETRPRRCKPPELYSLPTPAWRRWRAGRLNSFSSGF